MTSALLRVVRPLVLVGICALLTVSPWSQARAQAPMPGEPLGLDTVIRPGLIDYARYTPSMCVDAVEDMRFQARRSYPIDTAVYDPEHDTLPTRAVAVARTCSQRFTAANVKGDELFNLAKLLLVQGRDAEAESVADQWLTARGRTSGPMRAWRLLDLFDLYLHVTPMRLVAAEHWLARLDSLGKSAAGPRLFAHTMLFAHTSRRFDTTRLERDAWASMALEEEGKAWLGNPSFDQYGWIKSNYPGALTSSPMYSLQDIAIYRGNGKASAAMEEFATTLSKRGYPLDQHGIEVLRYYGRLNEPTVLPPLPADHWIGSTGWPVAGKISMYWNQGPARAMGLGHQQELRRIFSRYGDKVNVTLLMTTQGYFLDSPPLTPEQEIEAIRHYFHDYAKIPVSIALDVTPTIRLPDGRVVYDERATFSNLPVAYADPRDAKYDFIGGGRLTHGMVDASGRVLMRSVGDEFMRQAVVDRALGKPAPH